ncbi:MAG: hypothetical protein Q9208_005347 [Pyrenodesmia sp. 3 TL-2023]
MTGLPSVSKRLFYRKVPNEPEEPTTTIVLTSPRSFYVDVRALENPGIYGGGGDGAEAELRHSSALQWAFAGTSESSLDNQGRRFSTWHHWIDSNSEDPALDKGEMITQADGTVLEKGTTVDPSTGKEESYEELWEELPTEKLTSGNNARVCTVLRTEDQEKMGRGMIIRLGDYCQGIFKKGGEVTVERWEWWNVSEISSSNDKWYKMVTIGTNDMPCDEVLGSEPPLEGQKIQRAGITWNVVEVSTW